MTNTPTQLSDAQKINLLRNNMDPEMLEAIASELTDYKHSARADSLRVIAKRMRAALEQTQ